MIKLRQILLVEDNPNDAELTMEALAEHHLANTVVWVKDGEEALEFLFCTGRFSGRECAEDDLAVILLDLKLPKVDGFDVLRAIRGDDRLKHIPVIIMTSSRQEKDMVESYELGTNAYVFKPVDFSEFMEAVKELGGFWALTREPFRATAPVKK
jgi:CheY-like chemotaxis protein